MAKKKEFDMEGFVLELSERLKDNTRAPNIKKYKPHDKQHTFHTSKKKKKLYIGGNRSGKTTGGVTEAIWRATCTHPYRPDLNKLGPTRGRVVAVDFIQGVEKIIIPQYKQWVYPSALRGGSWENAYDKNTRTLNFVTGSTIEFMSYDQDVDKFAGTSRHWVHFDEEPPYPIYAENMARLIDVDGDYWMTMTPLEGMNWVYDELYENNVNNKDGVVEVIEINTMENPYLSKQAIESFLDSVDKDEVQQRVKGEFVTAGGKIYKDFDFKGGGKHVLKEPIDDPLKFLRGPEWMWVMGLDHGLNNPTAVLWTAIHTRGYVVVFDEHYRSDWTIEQHAAAIKLKIKQHGRVPDIMVADPSIQNRTPITGTSIHTEYAKHGLGFMLGNNDVKAGILRVKRYLKEMPYVGNSDNHPLFGDGHVLRTTFVGTQKVETFSGLRISPKCQMLIHEMKRYRWKTYTNKKLAYENNSYEEPHKKDDHAVDTLRYILMSQPDLFAESTKGDIGGRKGAVHDALAEMGLMGDDMSELGFGDPLQRDIADPHDLLSGQSGWTAANDMPGNVSWDFDEHMGINY